MRTKHRLAALFCVLLVLATVITPAYAVPRATFTNAEPTTPDLYISKVVEDADSRYPSDPDTEFSFVLKLDGSLAKKLQYEVYGDDGQKVVKTESGTEVPYYTDSNGGFTLKAGQRAKFTYVGEGVSYEITEVDLPTGYTQSDPAGAAAGTVGEDGTFVEFTNRYAPVVTPTASEEEETTLTVEKKISWPSGYEYDEDAEFSFLLTVDGAAFADELYSVTDVSTQETVSSGKTDAEGRLTLKAGQKAELTVPLDVDYKITEEESDGWTSYGGDTQKGATTYPLTEAVFTNIQASFAVSKTTDTGTDEDFVFILYDADQKAWGAQAFYIYGSDGQRVDDQTYYTGEDGKFSLKAGQTAMFIGIAEGTGYSVAEQKSDGWTQAIPLTEQGYEDKTVMASVEVLPFVNEKIEKSDGTITVSKTVDTADGSKADTSVEFPFILSVKDGDDYVPVSSAVYSITTGNSVKTYKTDDEGRFTLRANQTAIFEDMEEGTYQIEEDLDSLDVPGYTIDETTQTGELSDTLGFSFVNNYDPYGFITLTKADTTTSELLSDAVFGIYTDEECTNEVAEMTTGSQGVAKSEKLAAGTYYVKEIIPPANYSLSDTVYMAEVVATQTCTVHDEGSAYVGNQSVLGSITLKKYDSDGAPLEGVGFDLVMTSDNTQGPWTAYTNEDGEVVFEGLQPGTYEFTETKTVPGHNLLSESVEVTLPVTVTKADADVDATIDTSKAVYDEQEEMYYFYDVTYIITNNALLTIPASGSNGFPILIGIIGLVAVTGGLAGAYVTKRKRNKKII